jgi:HAD superfamily hydrolase (TIGR01509 family)
MPIAAVVFDLDGVLLDSEQAWDDARRSVVADAGRPWPDGATRAMMGMSSREWSRHLHDELGVPAAPDAINDDVVVRVMARYRTALPLVPGAREAVERLAERWPLGLATSSNREVVDLVLDTMGVGDRFAVTVSSEEVPHGKPAPDVYLEAARRLGVEAAACAAIEDSENGIRSAHAAGMRVIALPNAHFPPAREALDLADVVLDRLDALTPEVIERR